jgi:hypothetical protein
MIFFVYAALLQFSIKMFLSIILDFPVIRDGQFPSIIKIDHVKNCG